MKSCVLIIDMQQGLFAGQPEPYEAGAVIKRINRITHLARQHAIPIIFTQYELTGFLDYGSPAWRLHPDLTMDESDIKIRKTTTDPFLSSDLDARLRTMSIEKLYVCGYASELCVDTTVRRASGLGYEICLIADAHTTQDKAHLSARRIREHHNITLSMAPNIMALTHDRIEFE